MRDGFFNANDWTSSLAESLSSLSREQDQLLDRLGLFAETYITKNTSSRDRMANHHYAGPSGSLYHAAVLGTGLNQDAELEPFLSELLQSIELLRMHPSLSPVVDMSNVEQAFLVVFPEYPIEINVLHILDGLMIRAKDSHQQDGFIVACRELCELLGTNLTKEIADLKHGYHVCLLHGLRFQEEFLIGKGSKIVPFEKIRHYIDEDLLRPFSPNLVVPRPWPSLCAIVKPFEWCPEFRPISQDEISLDTDWGQSFRQDAEQFSEFLAITHGAPVVTISTMFYCVHPLASKLLGQRNSPTSYVWGSDAHSFDRSSKSRDASADATKEAVSLFKERSKKNFSKIAPVVSRLATAVTRKGRFALDDQILDVAMALERMYGLSQGEISFKLKMRAACFLESTIDGRSKVFETVKTLYDLRSAIVHGNNKKQGTTKQREETFQLGFGIARKTLLKLIQEGTPKDWNQVVIAGTGQTP